MTPNLMRIGQMPTRLRIVFVLRTDALWDIFGAYGRILPDADDVTGIGDDVIVMGHWRHRFVRSSQPAVDSWPTIGFKSIIAAHMATGADPSRPVGTTLKRPAERNGSGFAQSTLYDSPGW